MSTTKPKGERLKKEPRGHPKSKKMSKSPLCEWVGFKYRPKTGKRIGPGWFFAQPLGKGTNFRWDKR